MQGESKSKKEGEEMYVWETESLCVLHQLGIVPKRWCHLPKVSRGGKLQCFPASPTPLTRES